MLETGAGAPHLNGRLQISDSRSVVYVQSPGAAGESTHQELHGARRAARLRPGINSSQCQCNAVTAQLSEECTPGASGELRGAILTSQPPREIDRVPGCLLKPVSECGPQGGAPPTASAQQQAGEHDFYACIEFHGSSVELVHEITRDGGVTACQGVPLLPCRRRNFSTLASQRHLKSGHPEQRAWRCLGCD